MKDNGRHKARGCEQQREIDYEETYSLVLPISTLRFIMALSVREKYNIIKFDIKTAFLYGKLDEQLYIKLPEGFENGNKICKLQKLYTVLSKHH